MRVVIVSGGKAPSYGLVEKELENSDFLICADSGGNCLYEYNINPNYLMGDFDSISKEALDFFKGSKECTVETYPRNKNFTDTEIVLSKALELGANEIVLLGCTGSRIDHVMGNLGMLLKCLKLDVKAYIKDDNNIIQLIDKSTVISEKEGTNFSLQAYDDIVKNLSIIGAKYKLLNYDLEVGDSRTISNEFLCEDIELKFSSGKLLVFLSQD